MNTPAKAWNISAGTSWLSRAHRHLLMALIGCGLWGGMSSASLAQTSPATLSKEDIAMGVEASRSQIEDLSVSFTFDWVKAPPNNLHARSHKTCVVKGAKAYIDHEYGRSKDYDDATFHFEVAYNGQRTTSHEVHRGVASVQTIKRRDSDTKGSGFFDLMMLNASREGGSGFDDQSLISLVRSDNTQLRKEVEIVNGRPCHVLDVMNLRENKPAMTVWLDVERGFLPVRQVFNSGKDLSKKLMELTIEEAVELPGGGWFATHGRKKVFPLDVQDASKPMHEMVLEVDGWREGNPSIAVNSGVEDEFFDLWKRVPPGTRLIDGDVGVFWTVGGTDYEGLADSVGAALKAFPVEEENDASPVQGVKGSDGLGPQAALASTSGSGRTMASGKVPWTPILVAVGLLAVGGLVVGIRKARNSSSATPEN